MTTTHICEFEDGMVNPSYIPERYISSDPALEDIDILRTSGWTVSTSRKPQVNSNHLF